MFSHVVLIRDYKKFMNAISETLNVVCTEWPIRKGSDSILNILSSEGNCLELFLLVHMGRFYLPDQTISNSTNGTDRHRFHRNPKTYLDIRQELKEKNGREINVKLLKTMRGKPTTLIR